MARISREEVERVAALARLSVSDEEAERLAVELDRLLEYVDTLDRLDTTGIEPTAHAIPVATPVRQDRAEPPIDPELAVANAPQHAGSAFLVPKVIEGEEEG